MPLRLTTSETEDFFKLGANGQGQKALTQYNLQKEYITQDILKQVALFYLNDLKVKLVEIAWIGFYWIVIVSDDTNIKPLPCKVAGHACGYHFASQAPRQDPAALRAKKPDGTVYDDSSYDRNPAQPLRPGVMLSSSMDHGIFSSSSSGILVADEDGSMFITASSHTFATDNKVYHPKPWGRQIGTVHHKIPYTDISLVKLNSGIRYLNEAFGVEADVNGTRMAGILTYSQNTPSLECRAGDDIWMDNPFSGRCEGTFLGPSLKVEGIPEKITLVRQKWMVFENGTGEPIEGSCGSAVMDDQGRVIAFFRFLSKDGISVGVAAQELRENGYEMVGGAHEF